MARPVRPLTRSGLALGAALALSLSTVALGTAASTASSSGAPAGAPALTSVTDAATSTEPATPADAQPGDATLVPIQVTGDDANRFSMVVMGDGFTADEQGEFREAVEEHLNVMWSIEPFRSYRNYINVYAIEVVSAESGVDCDPDLDSGEVDTALDMGFWGGCNPNSVQRLLTVDNTAANEYAALAPANDQILALGNSDTYGGAGGRYATASSGNALSALISPHELAHSLGGLQDEYDYYSRGITTGDYTGGEPNSIHHTLLTEEEMLEQQAKWWRWLGEESEAGGTIGRYEGGMYYSTGLYRPSEHSMMKTLGFPMDQVSRERMTERISARVDLVEDSTATDSAPGLRDVLWVETVQPSYHDLDTVWTVDGVEVPGSAGSRELDLEAMPEGTAVAPGAEVTVTVSDPTEFVRDPALQAGPGLTAQRSWTLGSSRSTRPERVEAALTNHTPDNRPVGGEDVVFVQTSHARDRAFAVEWSLDGEVLDTAPGQRTLDLGDLGLTGSHQLTAEVTDPFPPRRARDSITWTVDATPATVEATFSEPLSVQDEPGQPRHYTFRESFEMTLETADDSEGAVVAEFRLDGDGWHHYYGWPTDPDAPFLFTPTGTNVDDLIYGNLGTGGISLSPFQPREPGYGTHTLEFRTIDAAGNISEVDEVTVTVLE